MLKRFSILLIFCVGSIFSEPKSLLPDSKITPGVTNPNVTQENIRKTICKHGWTSTVRPKPTYTNKLKMQQMMDLGLKGNMKDYEEDHFIPLEIGGNPTDPGNLYPQLWPEARQKDRVETFLKRQVCDSKMTLEEARKEIYNWPDIYEQIEKGKSK